MFTVGNKVGANIQQNQLLIVFKIISLKLLCPNLNRSGCGLIMILFKWKDIEVLNLKNVRCYRTTLYKINKKSQTDKHTICYSQTKSVLV